MMNRIIIFILVLLFCIILYLSIYYYTTKRNHYYSNNNYSNNNLDYNYPTNNFNQNSNHLNDNIKIDNNGFDLDVDVDLDVNFDAGIDNNINKDNIKGYENEVMYISDDLKDGSYVNQFKEIDYSKMKLSDNQIGFDPEPRCSSGPLPFVDVNVNYLLKTK